jgi:ferrous iron transport protein B
VAFVPQIAILFFFIAILEDCGYLARGAFLMDRSMARIGLSGKSFVPMLSSFACAVPGIMAARVVENERDRLTTILVAPLLTCSARLPVYTLLIAAFIPNTLYCGGLLSLRGLCLAGLYLLGIGAAVAAALVLKKTLLRGDAPLFFMELPSYKWPSPRTVLLRVLERIRVFFRCAGTLILAISVLTWAAVYYPHSPPSVVALRVQRTSAASELDSLPLGDARRDARQAELQRLDRQIATEAQRQSWLGRVGRLVEPVVRPLGWDWRIGCAVIASFPAREVVVAALGVIFSEGRPLDPESDEGLQAALRQAVWEGTDRPLFNTGVALSLMVFFTLCAQCVATLAMIRRETNSWRWPLFTFTYMTLLAYLGAAASYHLARWTGIG